MVLAHRLPPFPFTKAPQYGEAEFTQITDHIVAPSLSILPPAPTHHIIPPHIQSHEKKVTLDLDRTKNVIATYAERVFAKSPKIEIKI